MTTRQQRYRQLFQWAISTLALGVSLIWLGLAVLHQDEAHLPLAFWSVAAAAVLTLGLFGRNALRRSPPRPPADPFWPQLAATAAAALQQPVNQNAQAEDALNDLAQSARTVQGLTLQPTRLRAVLQACVRRMMARGVQLRIHEGGDPHVSADAPALEHALDCLLRQAAEGIELRLTVADSWAEFTAAGVAPGPNELGVAQRIVEAHGGEIVRNATTCQVRLPLKS